MKSLKQSLGIDDTFTKLYRRPTKADEQTHVKDNVYLASGYNYMADILHLPTDTFGFNKLLVVVDLATDAFDIEKMKGETADETLKAFKKMTTRGIIKIPEASMMTDGGSSFKSTFHEYLYENGVNQRTARAGRHHQLSNVDSLCRQLGDIFNGIMNSKEEKSGKISKSWTGSIDDVREKLNAYRKKRAMKMPSDLATYEYPFFDNIKVSKKKLIEIKPKYKVGDLVNVMYEVPHTMNGKKQNTSTFRMGDLRLEKEKRKINTVLNYSGFQPYRYLVDGLKGASYIEDELKQV